MAGTAAPSLTRFAWLSVAAAIVTIGLKTAAYWITGSIGLLADAAESLINLAAALVSLWMLSIAAKPADTSHPFGHGKAEYFASGFEGILIILAAVAIAFAAWDRFEQPQPLAELNLGIGISSAAGLVNLVVGLVLLRAGRRYGSIALEADGRHLMTDVWTTAAVLGALVAILFTGRLILDPIIAWLAAAHIVWAGLVLVYRSLAGLLDAALPGEELEAIEAVLSSYQDRGVQYHDLRARAAGSQRLVTLHALVPGDLTVRASHDLVESLEADIRAVVHNATVITHVEPLEDDASYAHERVLSEDEAKKAGNPGGSGAAKRWLGAIGLVGGGVASMLTGGYLADAALVVSLLGMVMLMVGLRGVHD